jgi:predicted DCC family thiol-disulfide oxidoreductase YuxK
MSRPKHLILFDGDCPMCTFQMRLLTWLDWFNLLSFCPIANPEVAKIAPTLTREQLLEAIHCIATDGRIYRGARCIRFVGARLPLLIPLTIILWIPGVIWIAERVYMWISRNRHLISRVFGCKGACSILPARERKNDAS